MIRRVVDFPLNKRLFVLAFALLLVGAGLVAFHALPIEAYPGVADNYVEVIAQWPGISAALLPRATQRVPRPRRATPPEERVRIPRASPLALQRIPTPRL
ncbi:MAG: efflux RND transporter permease subunit [Bryobacteraceae bacterium]|jgi:Cu/Ag efflux pump CusA